jgi:hypothetical protein
MIEASWLRALEIGEQPQLQDTVRGRGSYLAAYNLSVLHAGLGHEREAAEWRERAAALRAAEDAAANWPVQDTHFSASKPAPQPTLRP